MNHQVDQQVKGDLLFVAQWLSENLWLQASAKRSAWNGVVQAAACQDGPELQQIICKFALSDHEEMLTGISSLRQASQVR